MSVVASTKKDLSVMVWKDYNKFSTTIQVKLNKMYIQQVATSFNINMAPPQLVDFQTYTIDKTVGVTVEDELIVNSNPQQIFMFVMDYLMKSLAKDVPPEVAFKIRQDIQDSVAKAVGYKVLDGKVSIGSIGAKGWSDLGWTSDESISFEFKDPLTLKTTESSMLQGAAYKLPGVRTTVEMPCICNETWKAKTGRSHRSQIYGIIQHLNDECKWSRERIADWLDELHDSGVVDIEFKVEIDE